MTIVLVLFCLLMAAEAAWILIPFPSRSADQTSS